MAIISQINTSGSTFTLAIPYGTCSVAVGTAAKTATISGVTLSEGTQVRVKFTNGNSAATPTLNINSTGAKSIVTTNAGGGESIAWAAGAVIDFTYNGTAWVMDNVGAFKAGSCTVAGGGLSKGTASGGGLSGGGLTGGGLSNSGTVTPTVDIYETASASQDNTVTLDKVDVGDKNATDYPYYFKVTADTTATSAYASRAGVTRGQIDRAAFSQTVTRANITDAHTAGYIPDKAATTVISTATETVSLGVGSMAATIGLTAATTTISIAQGTKTEYVKLKKGALGASSSQSSAGSANVSTNMTPVSSSSFTISLSTSAGAAKGSASVSSEGWVKNETGSQSGTTSIAVNPNTTTIYIKEASATATAGGATATASIAKQPSASASINPGSASASISSGGIVTTTSTTSYYVSAAATATAGSASASAASGYSVAAATATGGSATVGEGYTTGKSASGAGANKSASSVEVSASTTSSASTVSKSTVVYIPAGSCVVGGGGLSKGTASGGTLSGGDLGGGTLSGGTISGGALSRSAATVTPSVDIYEVASASQDTNINIDRTDVGAKDTTNYKYYFKVGAESGASTAYASRAAISAATVTRAKVTRATVTRAAFSQSVTRATITDTHTAGYIPAQAEKGVIAQATETVSLSAGYLAGGEMAVGAMGITGVAAATTSIGIAKGTTTEYVKMKAAELSAVVSSTSPGRATVTTSMSVSATSTAYNIALSTGNGSATPKAGVTTQGYVVDETKTGSATAVSVSPNTTIIYIKEATATAANGTASASASIAKQPSASTTASAASAGVTKSAGITASGVTTTATNYYVSAAATATSGSASAASGYSTATATGTGGAATVTAGYTTGTNKAGTSATDTKTSTEVTASSAAKSANASTVIYFKEATCTHDGNGLSQGTASGGGLTGGGLTASTGEVSITQNPAVTPKITGTSVAAAAATFGITTTKPSGTDGTAYLTFDPDATVTQEAKAKGRGSVSRAKVTRAKFTRTVTRATLTCTHTEGYMPSGSHYMNSASSTVELAADDGTTIPATSGTSNWSGESTSTTSVAAGTNYYVPIVSASATATNGTASVTAQPSASAGATAGTASATVTTSGIATTTTATSYYVVAAATATGGNASSSANSGVITATGGNASASVGKGITGGASVSKAGTSATTTAVSKSASTTGSSANASKTVYIPAADCSHSGNALSQGTASGGTLSGGAISGGTLAGGGLSGGGLSGGGAGVAASGNVSLTEKTSQPTSGYYITVQGSAAAVTRATVTRAAVTRSTITRAAVERAAFSQTVTRATLTCTHTAGYMPAGSHYMNSTSSTVELAKGTLTAGYSNQTQLDAGYINSTSVSASTATKYYQLPTGSHSISGGGVTQGSISGGGLSGGVVTGGAVTAVAGGSETTKVPVTPKVIGSAITNATTYGITTTKPSGTDGTNYLTFDPDADTTAGSVNATADASRTDISGTAVTRATATCTATRATISCTSTAGYIAAGTISQQQTTASATLNSGSKALDVSGVGRASHSNNKAIATSANVAAGTNYYVPIVTASAANGTASATASIAKQPSASTTASSAGVTITGMVTTATNTGYKVEANATSGSASAASGYSTATATGNGGSASVGKGITAGASASGTSATDTKTSTEVTASSAAKTASTTTYIQKGVLSAGVTTTDGSATVATSMSVSATSTAYNITLTPGNGSATGSASVATEGYVKNETASSGAKTVTVTPNTTTIYIKKGVLSVAGSATAGSSLTIAPGNVTIAKDTTAVSGKTRIDVTPVTTTSSISTYYLAIKANAASNSGTSSIYRSGGTSRATVTTAGYLPVNSSASANTSVSGTATVTISAKDSAVYYLPISSGVITNNTSGGTSSGTINAGSQIKIGAGYYGSDTYYQAASNPTLSGNAAVGEVLAGKTFYNSSYTKQTGTMVNHGTYTATISAGSSVSLSGYYAPGSYVTAESSPTISGWIKCHVSGSITWGIYGRDPSQDTGTSWAPYAWAWISGSKVTDGYNTYDTVYTGSNPPSYDDAVYDASGQSLEYQYAGIKVKEYHDGAPGEEWSEWTTLGSSQIGLYLGYLYACIPGTMGSGRANDLFYAKATSQDSARGWSLFYGGINNPESTTWATQNAWHYMTGWINSLSESSPAEIVFTGNYNIINGIQIATHINGASVITQSDLNASGTKKYNLYPSNASTLGFIMQIYEDSYGVHYRTKGIS